MILEEARTAPARTPMPAGMSGWAQASELTPTTSAAIVGGYQLVPETIRTRLARPAPGTNARHVFRFTSVAEQANINSAPNAGQSANLTDTDGAHCDLVNIYLTNPWSTLTHEVGHALDFRYNRLWRDDSGQLLDLADGTNGILTDRLSLRSLFYDAAADWQAYASAHAVQIHPYGFTSVREWFAQIFMYWCGGTDGDGGALGAATPANGLLVLAGTSTARLTQIRDEIARHLPALPAMPGLT